jgi:hypothetical protein
MKQYDVRIRVTYTGLLEAFAESWVVQYLTGLFALAKVDISIESIKEA